MGIGASLFLIALGAIFAFAVNIQLDVIDLNVVGWILMAVGAFGMFLSLWYWRRRRRGGLVKERVFVDDPGQPPPPDVHPPHRPEG